MLRKREDHKTSKFIDQVVKWFDVMNSSRPHHDTKSWACGYGLELEEQETHLITMEREMRRAKLSKKSRAPFMDGIVMNCVALRGLKTMMSVLSPQHKYILTNRLNQDYIENYFSRIRGLGGFHKHPLRVQFKTEFLNCF